MGKVWRAPKSEAEFQRRLGDHESAQRARPESEKSWRYQWFNTHGWVRYGLHTRMYEWVDRSDWMPRWFSGLCLGVARRL